MLVVTSPNAKAASTEEYLWKGNLGGALEQAQREAQAAPNDVERQEMLIDVLLTIGLADRAAITYRDRVSANPTDADAHYLLGRALIDPVASRVEYERALKLNPDHARSYMGLGALHVAAGRDDEAEAAYQRAVNLNPTLSEAWVGLARIRVVKGDVASALNTTHIALQSVRDEPALYFLAAALEPGKARSYLQTAVEAAPRDPSAHSGLAEVLLQEGDAAGAIREATAALSINPTLVDAQKTLVFATELSRGALDVKGYLDLATVHDAEATDPKAALASYTALFNRYPKCGVILLARGQLKLRLNDRAGGGADLERAMSIEPDSLDITQAYGIYALQSGRPDVAKPWLERAQDARPWDAALAMALGQVYRKTGEKEGAKRVLAEAWAAHPWDAQVAIAYAQALLDAGEAEASYLTIRDAARRIPDPNLGVALITSATAAGHYAEAAAILEDLGKKTGRQSLLDAAAKLRAQQK